jgi:Fe-S-cluster containining protein
MQETKPKFVFTCKRCGQCCERDTKIYLIDIERWSKDGSIYQIFSDLAIYGEPVATSIHLKIEDDKCKMFNSDSKECKIYNNRPISCKAYPLKYDGNGFLLSDPKCPGLEDGQMSKEALDEIRTAAVEEFNEESRILTVLPLVQALLLAEMAKKSEEAYSKLSDEERAKLEEILKKDK